MKVSVDAGLVAARRATWDVAQPLCGGGSRGVGAGECLRGSGDWLRARLWVSVELANVCAACSVLPLEQLRTVG